MYCNPLILLTEIGEAASKRCHLRETGRIGRRPPGVGGQLVTWGPNHGGSSLFHVQPTANTRVSSSSNDHDESTHSLAMLQFVRETRRAAVPTMVVKDEHAK